MPVPRYTFDDADLVATAQAAVARVEQGGHRAVTRLTHREITAMAALLQILGVKSVPIPKAGSKPTLKPHTPIDGDQTL